MDSEKNSFKPNTLSEIAEILMCTENESKKDLDTNFESYLVKSKEPQEDQSCQTNKTTKSRLSKTHLLSRQASVTEPLSRKQSLALTRSSISALTFRARLKLHKNMMPTFFEATYRLEPVPPEKFNHRTVERMLKEELDKKLFDKTYDHEMAKTWIVELSSSIRKAVKELGYKRYKTVCFVTLVQNLGQSVQLASRCLWHENLDDRATWIFSNSSFICDATVFGLYYE